MKTPKYYRLDEKVGRMRGGEPGIYKRTKNKVKDYGIRAKKQLSLGISKLSEQSFFGFKTKSHKDRKAADNATGLSSRDRKFIANKLEKTSFNTNASKARHSRKLRKIHHKLKTQEKPQFNDSVQTITQTQQSNKNLQTTPQKTQSIENIKLNIEKLYKIKQTEYKTNFEEKTQKQLQNFLTTKKNYIKLKKEYNNKVKAVENARLKKRQAFIDGKSENSNEVKNLAKEKQNAKSNLETFKQDFLQDLKNARKKFSKAEKKYSKLLTKKGSIEQLNQYSKNQTLGKRAGRIAKDFLKTGTNVVLSPITIPFKISKTIYKTIKNPMKQYRKFKGTRKYFTEKLDGSKTNQQTKIKNRLRQEFDINPEKRAKIEKSVYAMEVLPSYINIKNSLPSIDISEHWSINKQNLKNKINNLGLLKKDREIIMDGYKSQFLMEHLKQDKKTMNQKVINADRILMTSKNKTSLPGTISQNSLERFINEKNALMKKYNLTALTINNLKTELSSKNLSDAEKAKIEQTFNDGLKARRLNFRKNRITYAYNYLSSLSQNNLLLSNKHNLKLHNMLKEAIKDPNFERLTGNSVENIEDLLNKFNPPPPLQHKRLGNSSAYTDLLSYS